MHPHGSDAPAVRWRLLDTPPAAGAWNMAVDEALAHSVAEGGAPVLRFYRWSPACLSLGRNQPARGRYDLDALAVRGIDVVRRPTGGRAVLHDRELTYSVAAPEALLGGPKRAYHAINRALVAGLRRLGVAAALQPVTAERAPAPSLAPCFDQPVEGEVVAAGRKLVGSAQRRLGTVILQHGSLPIEDDQSTVATLLLDTADRDDAGPPATLAEVLGRVPDWDELTAALAAGWTETFGGELAASALTGGERVRAEDAARRYAGAAWTWHQ
ncbi:lipoate--protein ligase family protein [Longimicrobium sp.]|uniref:lipoate--protein ligase family protein n=1 Tax=Longimicrobium sp. TaxID=2029185 RepID=UPI002BC28E49|nr:lipoate--protein ligase family protein [Longimicrobium sp.]HSU17819.1 lipoate--protein ligase family protein [Longimicrobium sp.]